MTTTRSLRQLKVQMAQVRASAAQIDQVLLALRPPTGAPVALAAPVPRDSAPTDHS